MFSFCLSIRRAIAPFPVRIVMLLTRTLRLSIGVAFVVVVTGCGGNDDGEVEAIELEVGDCFNETVEKSQTVESVMVVSCDEAHDFEVYHAFDLEDGPYPGVEVVEDLWIAGCLDRFEDFVGVSFDASVLEISGIFPTEETWVALGDREVACSVTAVDGEPRTGSAAGAGI